MGLVGMDQILQRALRGGYAVGYYEAWDQYSFEAALEAAEELDAPAILGFGGAVTDLAWLDGDGIESLTALGRSLAERSCVPTALLFNEAQSYPQILRGLRGGCNVVMLDSSELGLEDNIAAIQQVVAAAHALGATVEAELGHLADASDPARATPHPTDPDEAARFVAATRVDALAVSVGNVHLLTHGEARIDLDRLEAIYQRVKVPLVIHGGTGFPAAAIRPAIERGVAKFNVGTRLKQLYLEGIAAALAELPPTPNIHDYVGSRGDLDVLGRGKALVKAEIMRLTRLYGSAGKAGDW